MNRKLKTCLLAGVSAAALSLAVVGSAQAFNTVNWTWNATITETITKDVTITIDLTPAGLVMLEDLQILIGDVTATATVDDINNNRPEGTLPTGVQAFAWHYDVGGAVHVNDSPTPGVVPGTPAFNCVGNTYPVPPGPVLGTCVDETDGVAGTPFNGTVYVLIDFDQLGEALTLDAITQLPAVVNAATAVGNNVSITTDVAVQLHEGQFVVGGPCGECTTQDVDGVFANSGLTGWAGAAAAAGVNTNLILAVLLGYEALNGNISPSAITAIASVTNILNATVDNAATAVANNLTVDVNSATNSLLIGDVTQFAFADVSATATVMGVNINNYSNLGGDFRPIVRNVATAVGNNKSITVMAPVIP